MITPKSFIPYQKYIWANVGAGMLGAFVDAGLSEFSYFLRQRMENSAWNMYIGRQGKEDILS
jgi:hypothetical protein